MGNDWTLAEVEPVTGRTHQIRVHAASIGHPLLGDKLYPDEQCYLDFIETGWTAELAQRLLLNRQALHAAKLQIEAPDGSVHAFEAPLPADLQEFWNQLNEKPPAPA